MLKSLHIKNYALISELDIQFEKGFSVLTGETGAGKSIIIGAINLLLGGRADTKSITEGENHCIIEAVFGSPDSDTTDQVVRRELHTNGRSRAFVNDLVVSQTELKAMASELIDIHSQHENLLLSNDDFQLNIIDSIAFGSSDNPEKTTYHQLYAEYTDLNAQLEELRTQAKKAHQDADYIQFQYQQLANAHLAEGEQEELEHEEYILAHAEDIKASLAQAQHVLDNEDGGVLTMLHSISLDSVSTDLTDRLHSTFVELQDILSEIEHLDSRTEADPQRLMQVQERLELLSSLRKKHDVQSVGELLNIQNQLEQQLGRLISYDEDIDLLEKQLCAKEKALTLAAEQLSKRRKEASPAIAKELITNLKRLGITHAKVEVEVSPLPDFSPTGKDNVQFLFAANLNQSLRRVSEVASGGEISRIMLCIKSLVASTNGLPTIIFDEIDTGVSGEIAQQMGHIMQHISLSRQVIAITHLPQIAALGDRQYKVYKQDTSLRTETNICLLSSNDRIHEIASMLSGKDPSEAAIDTATQLLHTTLSTSTNHP